MIVGQMLVHEANVKNTLGAVFAFARLHRVVFVFVEVGLQVSEKKSALDVTDFFVKGQYEALEAVRAEMMQCIHVLLVILFCFVNSLKKKLNYKD